MTDINVGIVGYGNLGRGVQSALHAHEDINLVGVFTRRPVDSVDVNQEGVKVLNVDDAQDYVDDIDVMLLCGGSATDLPVQGPKFAAMFNTVDSYDNHNEIPEYYSSINEVAKENGNTSAISIGWDPGLFSLNRMIAEAILPAGKGYTFWGDGVSQGHSDAIRRIEGVADAVQYTLPITEAIDKVREGEGPELSTKEKHTRDCYVVAEEGADKEKIAEEIKTMPNYFEPYETDVTFISQAELESEHAKMPHGGFVIRTDKTGENKDNSQVIEFSLKLDSNPEFTASVLVAYARAVHRLNNEGQTGAKTVFDIAPAYLSKKTGAQLRKELL